MAETTWIEEFLFRGRPPGSADAPDYHVKLGAMVADPFGGAAVPVIIGPLTSQEAEAKGFSMDAVLAGVNAAGLAAMDAVPAMQKQIAALREQVVSLQEEVAEATSRASAAEQAMEQRKSVSEASS